MPARSRPARGESIVSRALRGGLPIGWKPGGPNNDGHDNDSGLRYSKKKKKKNLGELAGSTSVDERGHLCRLTNHRIGTLPASEMGWGNLIVTRPTLATSHANAWDRQGLPNPSTHLEWFWRATAWRFVAAPPHI